MDFSNKRVIRDSLLAIGLLMFSCILAAWLIPGYIADYATGQEGLSPRFFPYLITATLALLSLLLLISGLRAKSKTEEVQDVRRLDLYTFLGISTLLLYYLAARFIGILPSSVVAVAVLMILYGFRKWWIIALFSLGFPILLFFFFEKIAQVPIPRGVFFEGLY